MIGGLSSGLGDVSVDELGLMERRGRVLLESSEVGGVGVEWLKSTQQRC